ncbi:MAG: penicillin-binding transpeptidase domain-containing protein [Faecalibacterium sp.]
MLECYTVGSVFKPVLAAAALEQGTFPEYECTGAAVIDGQIFRCAGGVPHGQIGLEEALEKSCNGYFVRLGQQLGAENLLQAAQRFGFGQEINGRRSACCIREPAGRSRTRPERSACQFQLWAGQPAGIAGADRRHDECHRLRRDVPHTVFSGMHG